MFSCGAPGVLSLVAFVPEFEVKGECGGDGPVTVHVTVCKAHARENRLWLQEMCLPGWQVDTWGTEMLLEHWGQIEDLGVPIWKLQHTATG